MTSSYVEEERKYELATLKRTNVAMILWSLQIFKNWRSKRAFFLNKLSNFLNNFKVWSSYLFLKTSAMESLDGNLIKIITSSCFETYLLCQVKIFGFLPNAVRCYDFCYVIGVYFCYETYLLCQVKIFGFLPNAVRCYDFCYVIGVYFCYETYLLC